MKPTTPSPTASAVCRGGWTRADWIAQQNGRKATLYVIRLTGHGETFYKVGITFCFSSRFSSRNLPYALRTYARYSTYSAGNVFDLEKKLHSQLAAHAYTPCRPFAGHTECFAEVEPILALLPKATFILKHVTR